MNVSALYEIKTTPVFEKQASRLIKKYKSLKQELFELIEQLEHCPLQGTALSKHCFKIRIAIKSKGKGKSGGARVITHVSVQGSVVFLLSIYDQSEQNTLTDKDLIEILNTLQS